MKKIYRTPKTVFMFMLLFCMIIFAWFGYNDISSAAIVYGNIDGYQCYGTLGGNNNYQTASTNSNLSAYHYAAVSFSFYYTDNNGTAQISSASASNNYTLSVSATAYSSGKSPRVISSGSTHEIKYGAYTWRDNI